jgi:glucan 1,3-beta-glucosidase
MKAIDYGNRCGEGCKSSTTQGALIYFPPGQYLISKPIIMPYFTILVGNSKNPPEIIGTEKFRGPALIDTNPYHEGISDENGKGIP